MNRNRLLGFTLIVLLITASFIYVISDHNQIAANNSVESEIDLARSAAIKFITTPNILEMYPNWENASLGLGQSCFDLENKIIAYLFPIVTQNGIQGSLVVGGEAYKYNILEAGTGSTPLYPEIDELTNSIQRDLAIKSNPVIKNPPKVLYLGYSRLYAEYQNDGIPISFHLKERISHKTADLKSSLTAPKDYKPANKLSSLKTNTSINNHDLSTPTTKENVNNWVDWINLDVPMKE